MLSKVIYVLTQYLNVILNLYLYLVLDLAVSFMLRMISYVQNGSDILFVD
ncbi:MAG: hypothetical protein P857_581 [Candidatus Xenolissoclinum pacificiensis L6]|uniref:Uncharacterized protein n=1 Tax=Candidatus Xenolissoclinum pacificiensis L6 TaxID=1401685 RepID=W2UYZ7_9RICK|nr:MAG: hypothetical protein P857_581 [Candidatus Xenolissoclinum pacificiensis L6]